MIKHIDTTLNSNNSYNGKISSSIVCLDDEATFDANVIKEIYENDNIKRIFLDCNFLYDDVSIDDEKLQKLLLNINSKIDEVESQEIEFSNKNANLKDEIQKLTENITLENKNKTLKDIEARESTIKENSLFINSLSIKKENLKLQKIQKINDLQKDYDVERKKETIERVKKLSNDLDTLNNLIDSIGILLIPMNHNLKTLKNANRIEHKELFDYINIQYESDITCLRSFQENINKVKNKLNKQFKG